MKKDEELKMFRKKANFLFLAFAVLLGCSFSEKEPEELIKLRDIAMEAINNKNVKKITDYTMQYMYSDYMNGNISEDYNGNINETLWKNQLWESCDTEIFPEEELRLLDVNSIYQQSLSFLSRFYKNRTIKKTTSYNITLVNDYDSLREYENVYTTESGLQEKHTESFIRINNKWLIFTKNSYNFAGKQNKNEELSTKILSPEFMGDSIGIYVQDSYRIYFIAFKTGFSPQIFSYELIGILKRSLISEDTKIIITSLSENHINSMYHIAKLLESNGYNYIDMYIDTKLTKSDISQDTLFKHNKKLKEKLEMDINISLANLNRNVCGTLPVAFAMDSLYKVHILPKYVAIQPIDYEFTKHYLVRSIQFNHERLQIRKNWAYCLDLVICPEKMK